MAGSEKDAYVALIAQRDPQIRALLDQGFEFVMNAFKAGSSPPDIKAKTDREQVQRLRQEGYQVEVTTAYDEQGRPRPTLRAIWRRKRQRPADTSRDDSRSDRPGREGAGGS